MYSQPVFSAKCLRKETNSKVKFFFFAKQFLVQSFNVKRIQSKVKIKIIYFHSRLIFYEKMFYLCSKSIHLERLVGAAWLPTHILRQFTEFISYKVLLSFFTFLLCHNLCLHFLWKEIVFFILFFCFFSIS